MSIEEVNTDYNKHNQLGPSQRMKPEEYKASGFHGGLTCIACGMVVNQDATVSPGRCLLCFNNPLQLKSILVRVVDGRTGEATDRHRWADCWVDHRGRACLVTEKGDYALWTGGMYLSRNNTKEEVVRYGWWQKESSEGQVS